MSLLSAHGGIAALDTPPAGSTYDDAILALSPWGYWKLDEASPAAGGTVADASGNGNDGTFNANGSGWSSVAGLYGGSSRAITFPSSGTSGVRLPDTFARPSATSPFTVLAFIAAPATSSSERSIVGMDDGVSGRIWQFRVISGKLQFVFILPSVVTLSSLTTFDAGSTHMVVAVYDPSMVAADGQMRIYIDGVLDAQTTAAVSNTATTSSYGPGIGVRNGGSNTNSGVFNSTIDNAAIFNDRALSAAEIASLWALRDN